LIFVCTVSNIINQFTYFDFISRSLIKVKKLRTLFLREFRLLLSIALFESMHFIVCFTISTALLAQPAPNSNNENLPEDYLSKDFHAGRRAALGSGRDRLGLGVLGLATAAKLYPAVLLPIALVWVTRRRGPREAVLGLGVFAAVIVAIVLPFLILAPGGVVHSLTTQLGRPLQIESLGAAILLSLHHAAGLPLGWASSHGSQNVTGTVAVVAAAVTSLAQVVVIGLLWARFARGPADAADPGCDGSCIKLQSRG